MATNIEIKATIRDFNRVKAVAEELSHTPCEVIAQEDTFFNIDRGRLKLRTLAPDSGQLIYYERTDTRGPKASHYLISTTADPHSLESLLAAALGVRGVVRKKRRLYLTGPTRIHLDEVEGLGAFLELEVVMNDEMTEADGMAIAADLMEKLDVQESDLIDVAYIDLLDGNV